MLLPMAPVRTHYMLTTEHWEVHYSVGTVLNLAPNDITGTKMEALAFGCFYFTVICCEKCTDIIALFLLCQLTAALLLQMSWWIWAHMHFLWKPWRQVMGKLCLRLHRSDLGSDTSEVVGVWRNNAASHLVAQWLSIRCLQEDAERKIEMGDSDRWRERASQWFPQAPVSIASPVAHLTHSLCWAKGKSDWAHYALLRTDARRAGERERESLFCICIVSGLHHYQECMAICRGSPYLTWLSSAFVRWEQMRVISLRSWLHQDIVRGDETIGIHCLTHSAGWWMRRDGWQTPWRACEVMPTSQPMIGGTFDELCSRQGVFSQFKANLCVTVVTLLAQMEFWHHWEDISSHWGWNTWNNNVDFIPSS